MNTEIKKLGPQEIAQFVQLIQIFEEVFEMEGFELPSIHHLQTLLAKDDFHVFVALADGRVIGGLTGYTLHQYYSAQPQLYIYDLGVKGEYQRQGIGRQLISGLADYCRSAGIAEAFVQADADDAHALDFYRSTGGIEAPVVHFSYPMRIQ